MTKQINKLNILYNIAFALPVLMILMVPGRPHAQRELAIDGANDKQCLPYFSYYEKKFSIPRDLLHSIATVESGRLDADTNTTNPWPWTANVEGKGYYFDTKQEAIDFVSAKLKQGVSSIDVGCMQVNLRYHPDAFSDLQQAFEPRYNVAYAAEYLRTHYESQANWSKAVGRYHSGTDDLGSRYAGKVLAVWRTKIQENRNKFSVASNDLRPMPKPRRFSRTPLIVVQSRPAMEVAVLEGGDSAKLETMATSKSALQKFGSDKEVPVTEVPATAKGE